MKLIITHNDMLLIHRSFVTLWEMLLREELYVYNVVLSLNDNVKINTKISVKLNDFFFHCSTKFNYFNAFFIFYIEKIILKNAFKLSIHQEYFYAFLFITYLYIFTNVYLNETAVQKKTKAFESLLLNKNLPHNCAQVKKI